MLFYNFFFSANENKNLILIFTYFGILEEKVNFIIISQQMLENLRLT